LISDAWGEAKRRANIRDHKVDFVDAAQIFDGRPTLTYYSPRNVEMMTARTGRVVTAYLTRLAYPGRQLWPPPTTS